MIQKLTRTRRQDQILLANNPKEKEETNPIKNHITDFRKEDRSRGEAMVEEVYTIRQNDPRYKPEQHDNRKNNYLNFEKNWK